MPTLIDHIDLRVASLARVRPLYDALLPALGYSAVNEGEESAGYHRPGAGGADPFIWLVQDPGHRPGGTRIAFQAASREDVDRLSDLAREHAQNYEAPELVREYGPAYYAAFFEDAEGNKLEICCRR